MRSVRARLAVGAAFVLPIAIAACGRDLATQPRDVSSAPRPPLPPSTPAFDRDASPHFATSGSLTIPFVIKPNEDNKVWLGAHYLVIPANAVCDPASSGYGDGTWDRPCSTIKRPLNVIATVSTKNGHPLVEFDTHLRFKPATDNSNAVVLYLRDEMATSASMIIWCPTATSTCIDESKTATGAVRLKTWFDNSSSWVYRRIEHFSGYNVTGGRDGDPTAPATGM